MLAKILEEMWVEPEVLEALSEEQKRILFLKMREEQVRRWREREEREGREDAGRPKKASGKHVTWLLGRDGDVSVSVIGDVDELRSSGVLRGLMQNRLHAGDMNGIQTAEALAGREARQPGFKEDVQPPLADATASPPSARKVGAARRSVTAAASSWRCLSHTRDEPASPGDRSSEEEPDDDLKDPVGDSDSESGSGSDSPGDWAPLYRPHFSSHGNKPPLGSQLSDAGRTSPQCRDICCDDKAPEYGGRVAQLRRAFSTDSHTPVCSKPPVPAKPAHLMKASSPWAH